MVSLSFDCRNKHEKLIQSFNHHLTTSLVHPLYYDPIKKSLGEVFNRTPWLRRLFYYLLDLLLLPGIFGPYELTTTAGLYKRK